MLKKYKIKKAAGYLQPFCQIKISLFYDSLEISVFK